MNLPTFMSSNKDNEAKFWLYPLEVAHEGKFRKSDLRDIERIIEDNLEFLLGAWKEEKSKHVDG